MRFFSKLIICCGLLVCLGSFTLADKLKYAQKGDYIVTEQDRTYSLLLIREINAQSILFEEISLPVSQRDSSISWKQWLESGAPGHTSWIMYEIDLQSLQLIEGYSFSKKGWLYLDDTGHFLSRLLSLPLQKVPEEERRRIGPAPRSDETDRRPLWNPPLVMEGKKSKASFEAWKTKWPKDDSLLSSCHILLYFQSNNPSFTFPTWIEATNGHYSYAIKAVDSGKGLSSPLSQSIPRRPPQFLKHLQKTNQMVRVPIKSPSYYKHFSLFVLDLLHPDQQIGPIPFTLKQGEQKEDYFLDISVQELEKFLTHDHRYKWILVPQGPTGFLVESEDFFLWPSLSLR
jgi:hypothetical protein